MNHILFLAGIVITICIFTGHFTSKLAVPSLLFFIMIGMLFGVDGIFRISYDDYKMTETICSTSLIFIIFYGGFGTNIKEARPVVIKSIMLSTIGVFLTAMSVGAFIHYVLHLNWIESLLIGSVISSTDAASVFNILRSRQLDLKYNTASLLEIESGSNDPISYMLTLLFASMLSGVNISVPSMLLSQIGIGIIAGIIAGLLSKKILCSIPFVIDEGRTIFTIAIMILSFSIPQLFNGNGYLSVYICGIIMGNSKFPEKRHLIHFFDVITGISQILIFFLLGLLVTPSELPEVMLPALLIMLFLTFIGRPLAVMLLLLPFRSKWKQIGVVSWSGLRGAASIVFAIMAVLSGSTMHYNLYNLIFCIVLLSITFQGTLLPYIASHLKMIDHSVDVRKTFNDYEAESNINFIKTKIKNNHYFCNQHIKDIKLPTEMLIVMILRGDITIIPNGNTLIEENDTVILAAPDFSEGEHLILQEKILSKGNKWIGKQLKDISIPKNMLIITVNRNDKTLIPTGNTKLHENDTLVFAHIT